MAVKLTSGGKLVPSLTSPPAQPVPYPPDDLIAEKVKYEDREILVTVPFPDTIVLITDVFNHHLTQPFELGGSVKGLYDAIDKEMREKVKGYENYESYAPFPATKVFSAGKNATATFRPPFDIEHPLERATLTIQRREGSSYGIWSVRLEFSVSKAGPSGLAKLTSLMHDIIDLNIENLFGTMRVRRLDAAIDLIGAEPIDLIAHVKKPGKRMVYIGDTGRPESIYLYERKPWLTTPPSHLGVKTTGPLRLKLYERRSYYEQIALEPLWGDCPVTRAEVQRTWTKNEPVLAELSAIKNPFDSRRVSYAAALAKEASPSSPSSWLIFCLAALGGGVSKTQAKTGLVVGAKFRKLYENCMGDLLHEGMWSNWQRGLAVTGLDVWIATAEANLPPEA